MQRGIEADTDKDNLPVAELIRKLSGCENIDVCEISEWFNQEESYKVTDSSMIESFNEAAQGSGNEEMAADTVTEMTRTKCLALNAVLFKITIFNLRHHCLT